MSEECDTTLANLLTFLEGRTEEEYTVDRLISMKALSGKQFSLFLLLLLLIYDLVWKEEEGGGGGITVGDM